ncbi:MAG TPA: hypothetical protein VGM01_15475 [Ktedonobacteraceae bacterium]
MGYTTWFEGQFAFDCPLTPEHKSYLKAFSEVRHMTWNAELLEQMEDDPLRQAVGLPLGENGRYFTGSAALHGGVLQHPALATIVIASHLPPIPYYGHNVPPPGVPGFWCHWEPNIEGTALQWNGIEKFGYYSRWLQFLLEHFLVPWGYRLDGQVYWRGEHQNDRGVIIVINNEITTKERPD